MQINPRIFREFSIRGVAERDLTDEATRAIGQALGTFFTQDKRRTLVVGRDVRKSSPRIGRALISGLTEVGIDVIDVGVVPTPIHNFATDFYAADGGIMVTASHNPPEYNGFKVRSDRTLHGDELQGIYHLASQSPEESFSTRHAKKGKLKILQPLPDYLDRVKSHADIQPGLKVVVDGGNGTNGIIVSDLLRELGCQVTQLYCEPDGDFPHRDPDPTAPAALDDLARQARSEHADIGLAYDGDGDRLAVVDERGEHVLGDQVIMLLARDALSQGPARIVCDTLCSQAVADDVRAHGGELVTAPSGYAFVHQAMQETGAALGGEFSGHLFFNEPGFRFDDSILASIKVLNSLSRRQVPVSALVAELPAYYSSPQIRLACPDSIKAQVVEQIKEYYQGTYPVEELDGVRIHFGDGWALLRASNTQPALSLRFEATTSAGVERLETEVLKQVDRRIAHLSSAGNAVPTGR